MRNIILVFILLNSMGLILFLFGCLLIKLLTDEKVNFKMFLIFFLVINLAIVLALLFSQYAIWLENSLK